MTHETRFAKAADGVHLAYQVVGSGPVDVVMDFHAFAGNVDLIWDEPDWAPLLAQVTEFARLIVHDRRGSGASTRNARPRTSRRVPQICSRSSMRSGPTRRSSAPELPPERCTPCSPRPIPIARPGCSGTTRARGWHGLRTQSRCRRSADPDPVADGRTGHP